MSHEIEVTSDGKASFFSVLETAWHRLGEVLATAPATVAEALKLCRGDFEVETRPLSFTCYTGDGDTYPSESVKASAIVRTDTQRELGTASTKFPVLQNFDAFRPLDVFLSTGLLTVETGGVLHNGEKVFLLGKWDVSKFGAVAQEIYGREGIDPFALVVNCHTGRDGTAFVETKVRVVCQNTLGMAMDAKSNRVIMRHQKDGANRAVEVVGEMWGNIIAHHELAATEYKLLRETVLSESEFRAMVLDVIAPLPQEKKDFDAKSKRAAYTIARAENIRATVRNLWTGGIAHTGDMSAWEAYNGAIQAIDHDSTLFRSQSLETRAESLLDGALAQLKGKLYNGLLESASLTV